MASLSRLPSGTWRVAVKANGLRRTATARTKGDAKRLGAEMLLELGGSPRLSPTVGELLDAHLAAINIAPTTRQSYARVVDGLPDTFTSRPVREVGPHIVEGLYRQLAATGDRAWSPRAPGNGRSATTGRQIILFAA
jgi:hypothetical protein